MTPLMLQDDLIAEIKKILSGRTFKAPSGEMIPINVFAQHIPVNESDDDADPVPYIIVRLTRGNDKGYKDSDNIVKLICIIVIYDDSINAQGHRGVMNIIHSLYERFQKNPNLNNRAAYSGEFDWAMQEDTYYPYFFGACMMDFRISAIRREDPLT